MQKPAGQGSAQADAVQSQLLDHASGHLVTLQERNAACEHLLAECTAKSDRKCQQLQETRKQDMADLTKQHDRKLGEMADHIAKRSTDSKHFKYSVRGSQDPALSGIVPAAIFEAEPDSVLNKTYNGEWEYGQDADGRAHVNSNPEHWPLILDWLSFGAVPSQPSPAFLAECKYWQLSRLVAKLEGVDRPQTLQIQPNGRHRLSLSHVTQGDDRAGFNLCGTIKDIDREEDFFSVTFNAFGQEWELFLDKQGATILPQTGNERLSTDVEISFGRDPFKYLAVKGCFDLKRGLGGDHAAWLPPTQGHLPWLTPERAFKALQSEPFMDLDGKLLISVDVLFARRAVSPS